MAIKRTFLCDLRSNAETHLWASQLGRQTLEIERPIIANQVARLHGDCVLWVGEHPQSAAGLTHSMVRNSVYLAQRTLDEKTAFPAVGAELESLPFQSNAFEGIVLHHALEVIDDPRVALREIVRVLAPGGRLVLLGFNPWSLIGLRRAYATVVPDFLRARKMVNPLRLFDWLTLLGLELEQQPLYRGYGLMLNRKYDQSGLDPKPVKRSSALSFPFGGVLAITAVKQAVTADLQWSARVKPRRLAPVAYPSIASWQKVKNRL